MRLPKTPPTAAQWAHIFRILEGGNGAVQRAHAWLRAEAGSDMCLRTFKGLLSNEREERTRQREAAAVLMLDAVPLAGASFAEEGATLPPAAHGALVAPAEPTVADAPRAPHDVGRDVIEAGSLDDSQAAIGQKRSHEAAFSSSDGVEAEVQGDLGLAAEACAPPVDFSDGSEQPPLLLQTVNTTPTTHAPPPPAVADPWEHGATCPGCRANLAATVRVVQRCGSEGTVRCILHSCNVCFEAVAVPHGSSVLVTEHYPPGARPETPLIALVAAPDGPDPLAAGLAEAGAAYAQFADEMGAPGELNGERLLLNVAVEPDEAGTYAIDPGWTPGWVGEATNPSAPPDSAIHATYTRPPCEKAKKAKAKGKLRATIPQKNAAEFMRKVGTLYDAFATAAQRVLQRDVNSGKLDRLIQRMEGRLVPFGYHVRVLHLSAGEGIIAPPGADSQSYHKDELEELMWQVCCCHTRVCSERKPQVAPKKAVRRRGRCSSTAPRANRRRCWCATNEAIGRGAWRSSSKRYTAAVPRRASGGRNWRASGGLRRRRKRPTTRGGRWRPAPWRRERTKLSAGRVRSITRGKRLCSA